MRPFGRVMVGAALSALAWLSSAAARRCAIAPAAFPLRGDEVSPLTQVWIVCTRGEEPCAAPLLQRADGSAVPLVEVEQRRITEGVPRRLIRYAPAAELAPGEYELLGRSEGSSRFRVVPKEAVAPRVPTVLQYQFEMEDSSDRGPTDRGSSLDLVRAAHFTLQSDTGLVIADIGEATDDPLQLVSDDVIEPARGEYHFWLGRSLCHLTWPDADACLHTRVRFGTLSGEGAFSGWTGWIDLDFPGEDCAARVWRAERDRLRLVVAASVLGVLSAGAALWRFRRRRLG